MHKTTEKPTKEVSNNEIFNYMHDMNGRMQNMSDLMHTMNDFMHHMANEVDKRFNESDQKLDAFKEEVNERFNDVFTSLDSIAKTTKDLKTEQSSILFLYRAHKTRIEKLERDNSRAQIRLRKLSASH